MKLKIYWEYKCYSLNNSWENSNNPKYNVYIDNLKNIDYSEKNIIILYEPKSIIPQLYEYVFNNVDKFYKIFTHRKELCDGIKIININPFLPSWISSDDTKIYHKTKLVSMIASTKIMCKGHQYRQEIANRFPFKNHLFGTGRESFIKNKLDGLKDYMFSIAMENEVCDLYYTEKILDCFRTGTIPVYWGHKNISKVFNPDGILWVDEINISKLNNDLYLSKENAIRENYNIAIGLQSDSNYMIDYVVSWLK